MSYKIDIETLEALQKGDHNAFETIFIVYFKKVKYMISSIVRSEDVAEELAQDIFVKLWINHASINPSKSFSSFLYTSTRNATFNFLKHKLVENSYSELKQASMPEYSDNPEEIIYAEEIKLLIEMALCKMPARRREIYHLSRTKGLTNEEIATELNLSKKTVENQISLILRELRKVVMLFHLFFL